MLDRVTDILTILVLSVILFAIGYVIVNDYISLHQRIDTIEQMLQQPRIIPMPRLHSRKEHECTLTDNSR